MRLKVQHISISTFISTITAVVMATAGDDNWEDLQLPRQHIPYFFRNNPTLRERCIQDKECPYKNLVNESRCWGYELPCPQEQRLLMPTCHSYTDNQQRRMRMIGAPYETPEQTFWFQADFGYVKLRRDNMVMYCKPETEADSSLVCADGLKYCRGRNIYIDLRQSQIKKSPKMYNTDLLKPGEIGGHCRMNDEEMARDMNVKQALKSWAPEMRNFVSLPFLPTNDKQCDMVIDRPTYIIKPDAGVSVYHHFCDFVNLYISQHVNNSFSTDVNVILWHTTMYGFGDVLRHVWDAFTDSHIILLKELDGMRVCFKDVIFSFLPRMDEGLFYTIRPIANCSGSGMMLAFSQHVLHRLAIEQHAPPRNKLRVTFISRSTTYRQILNEDKIVATLRTNTNLDVQLIDFTSRKISFHDQLAVTSNTDILIGIHGAGLTHMLFMPEWGAVVEINNCGDKACYENLARIRGLKYITWRDEKEDLVETVKVNDKHHGAGWQKFVNYRLDEEEAFRLTQEAVENVTSHPAFQKSRAEIYSNDGKDEL